MAIINEEKNFIFLHVFRTGGTSISSLIGPQTLPGSIRCLDHHCCSKHLMDWFVNHGRKDFWDNAFKFAFVRNPYDWQVSVYEYVRHSPGSVFYPEVKDLSFTKWLSWYEHKIAEGCIFGWGNNFCYTQKKALFWEGEVQLDFIGKFEHLKMDFRAVAAKLDVPAKLPHINQAARKKILSYYPNEAIKKKVQRIFAEDFAAFSYDPDKLPGVK